MLPENRFAPIFAEIKMRLLPLILPLLLSACSHHGKISLCSGEYWRTCEYYDSMDAMDDAVGKKNRELHAQAVVALKKLDIDPDECAAVVLKDLMGPVSEDNDSKTYISVIGADPSEKLLSLLRSEGIEALPASRQKSASGGDDGGTAFNIGLIRKRMLGGYKVGAGYYCGMLCAASSEYQLKKDGNTCSIVSKQLLWVS